MVDPDSRMPEAKVAPVASSEPRADLAAEIAAVFRATAGDLRRRAGEGAQNERTGRTSHDQARCVKASPRARSERTGGLCAAAMYSSVWVCGAGLAWQSC